MGIFLELLIPFLQPGIGFFLYLIRKCSVYLATVNQKFLADLCNQNTHAANAVRTYRNRLLLNILLLRSSLVIK